MIRFTVPGRPIAQPRQRFCIRWTRTKRPYPAPYEDSDHPVQAYKQAVRLLASAEHKGAPSSGPVAMEIAFFLDADDKRGNSDVDNLGKSVLDSLKGLVWVDDKQVTRLVLSKEFSAKPRTEVLIRFLDIQASLFEESA